MLIVINALKSITRSIGRNILIGIIVLAIAASSCVALAIRNAANEAEAAGVDSINITGSISVDRQKMLESMQTGGQPDMDSMRNAMSEYSDLSLSELSEYSDSDYVSDFYYSNSISLDAGEGLEPYSTDGSSSSSSDTDTDEATTVADGFFGGQDGGRQIGGIGITMGDFTVTGYSAESAMTKFINGTAGITDGEMFDITAADNSCLISYELSLFNGISVGDTITLVNPNAEDETYTLTVTGIYTDSSSSDSGDQIRFSTSQDPANLICISYGTLQEILDNSESVATVETDDSGFESTTAVSGQLSSSFVFSNQDDYDSFSEELTAKGLSEYYTLSSTDISSYESSLVPLKNLSQFATTLLFIILAIGAVILVVINIFNIRERKYEVGVLTAIGIKKSKVTLQFITELLCVTLVAIIIGAVIGAAVSVPVSNNLLSAQIEQMQTSQTSQEMSFGRGGAGGGGGFSGGGFPGGGDNAMISIFSAEDQSSVNYLDKINATVSFSILGQLIGIGVILTIISSLAAVIFVMRYEPLKILANR